MKKPTYSEYQNVQKHKISNKYSVMFFTIGRCAFFRYFEDDGIEVSPIDRSYVLPMLSDEEIEKLFAFEREKKKEFQTCVVYSAPGNDDEKNQMKIK